MLFDLKVPYALLLSLDWKYWGKSYMRFEKSCKFTPFSPDINVAKSSKLLCSTLIAGEREKPKTNFSCYKFWPGLSEFIFEKLNKFFLYSDLKANFKIHSKLQKLSFSKYLRCFKSWNLLKANVTLQNLILHNGSLKLIQKNTGEFDHPNLII